MHQPFAAPLGRRIAKIRGLRGIGPEMFAKELGLSVADVEALEESETVDDETLGKIANALGVTAESIRTFNDDAVNINIQNMNQQASVYHYNFNPVDKIVALYEDLLRLEREKIQVLEKKLAEK
ncbi:helix-turn-helix domain-containing protein [Taibaiella chishuiensis]|uniref:Helix-turn-helix protein n=1 Tax=Taibaiella chishuiensis TaxID=1434707 RepID=A0A2P8D0R0_9BACT|nr:helix-turn-helix domain-containing protein [Taibaiella chishuiensis]PSK90812.1 helix-turn-helix protein [Taibaiella chishuiensis]